ncbi:hypothetical protein [Hugenholtzia roseola]|uniref:hypothetical protein n=1 Tax=Hugenholtzia roseola TaxID=1002 RepID=UPI000400AAA2|nr:hypothetical protein [Hugenholtzia roseola]
MENLRCPYCDFSFQLNGKHFSGGLPPTGGDYEWSESDTKRKCPSCQGEIPLRLRSDIETGIILKVCKSPKPFKEGITWYAVGTVYESFFEKGCFSVSVQFLFEDFAQAQKKAYHPYKLLKVTKEGYFLYEKEAFADLPLPEEDYHQPYISYAGY